MNINEKAELVHLAAKELRLKLIDRLAIMNQKLELELKLKSNND